MAQTLTKEAISTEFDIVPLHPVDAPLSNIRLSMRDFLSTLSIAVRRLEQRGDISSAEYARLCRIQTVLCDAIYALSSSL
jgi:hypothetical protein